MDDSSGIVCPKCSSHNVERVHRSFFEKLITKTRKYRCHNCKIKFFRKKPS